MRGTFRLTKNKTINQESNMITKLKRSAYFSIIFLSFIACQSEQNSGPTKAEVKKAISQQNKVFMDSFQSSNLDKFASLYTKDGKALPPNMKTVSGREGIKHMVQGMHNSGISEVDISTDELHLEGNSAIEVGHYKVKIENGQVLDKGKTMVYWKKEGDTWRMYRDMWNSNGASSSSGGR